MNALSEPRLVGAIVLGLVAATATGCDSGGESVEIAHPPPGAVVSVPFEVTVAASVPLGTPAEDRHHLHIWFSGDEAAYLVVESATVEIENVPPGEHEMFVSLRNPDHTAAGAETSVALSINGPRG